MPYTVAEPWFGELLRTAGWKEVVPFAEFRKEHRTIVFDTSNWMELYIDGGSRLLNLEVPTRGHEQEALLEIGRAFSEGAAAAKR